jgi:hypothetical protein
MTSNYQICTICGEFLQAKSSGTLLSFGSMKIPLIRDFECRQCKETLYYEEFKAWCNGEEIPGHKKGIAKRVESKLWENQLQTEEVILLSQDKLKPVNIKLENGEWYRAVRED